MKLTKTCGHCRQPIYDNDYIIAGLIADHNHIPQNVYVHPACKAAYIADQRARLSADQHS